MAASANRGIVFDPLQAPGEKDCGGIIIVMVRKRRTREHIIADLSVNYVERQALLSGYTVERFKNDYGYDLFMLTYDANGEVENGDIRLQVKASDALDTGKANTWIPFRIARSDLLLWLNELMPVILIVYDAQSELAYWLYVQRYFSQIEGFNLFTVGKSVTVRIPRSSQVEPATMAAFAEFRNLVYSQRRTRNEQ